MIKVRLQIEDGQIYDTASEYGLIYLNADKVFAAPIKKFEESSYPEQAGVNIHPSTVDDKFEYKITFFVNVEKSLERANKKIAKFNNLLYTQEGNVKTFKRVTFYDDYKKVMVVGYPQPIKDATDFFRDSKGLQKDVVCVEWVIVVNDPSLCNFNLVSDINVLGSKLFIDGDVLSDTGNITAKAEIFVKNNKLIIKNL
jgi:hypothetical protein